jgi:hypothetical protein
LCEERNDQSAANSAMVVCRRELGMHSALEMARVQ